MGSAPSYWAENGAVTLQAFTDAHEHIYRDRLLNAGIVDKFKPFLELGPSCRVFVFVVNNIRNMFAYGNVDQVKKLRNAGLSEICVKWMSSGLLDRKFDNRPDLAVLQIIAFTASDPKSRQYIQKLIKDLQSQSFFTAQICERIEIICGVLTDEVIQVLVEENAIGALTSYLEKKDSKYAYQALSTIALMSPSKVIEMKTAVDLANACINRGMKYSADESTTPLMAASFLGACAQPKSAAARHIRNMVDCLEEDTDEAFKRLIAKLLTSACLFIPGVHTACTADVVEKAVDVLKGSKSNALKLNIIYLLLHVSKHSSKAALEIGQNSASMLIDLLQSGINDHKNYDVGIAALNLLERLSQSEALRPTLRGVNPLECLASVCKNMSSQRNVAIFTIANLYSESASVVENSGDEITKCVQELFSAYNIEKEVQSISSIH